MIVFIAEGSLGLVEKSQIPIETVNAETDFHIYRYDDFGRSYYLSEDNDIVMIG
ncbi:Uncharacterised protein [Mycobacterium tuberculosis]|nr:Uncharacterised protein [Mycobacterium tuberculosis]